MELRSASSCEPLGLVVGSDPPGGGLADKGAMVTVRTSVLVGSQCEQDYPARAAAWEFVQFALGRGPALAFARTVTVVVDRQDPCPLDHVAAGDPDRRRRDSRAGRQGRAGPRARGQRHAQPGGLGQRAADVAVRRTEAAGTGDRRVSGSRSTRARRRPSCPLTVDLYRSSDHAIDGVVVYTAKTTAHGHGLVRAKRAGGLRPYVAARHGRLVEHAVKLGCAEGEAGSYVDQVLLEQRKRIRRAEDPDPLVHEALERAIRGTPEPSRRTGPLVAVAVVVVAVAVGVVVTYRPTPDPLPSLFALNGDQAEEFLESQGYDVSLEQARSCEPPGLVVDSDPPSGGPVSKGATVTVRTSVLSGSQCEPAFPRRLAAWEFVQFALGNGPAPDFASAVDVVVDGAAPVRLTGDAAAAAQPRRRDSPSPRRRDRPGPPRAACRGWSSRPRRHPIPGAA